MNGRLSLSFAISLATGLWLYSSKSEACSGGSAVITNLPAISGSGYQVFGMNQAGELTGFFYVYGVHAGEGFLYTNNDLAALGTLGGSTSEGHWLNASGQVVGKADLSGNTVSHACLSSNGSLVDLGTLGGPTSTATAINDSGVIIGDSDLPGSAGNSAFIYLNGAMTGLGNLGSNYSSAFALNNNGLVVGEAGVPDGDVHGFSYAQGVLSDLGTLGGTYSAAFAVNDAGLIAGESSLANSDVHGFVYVNGSLTDVGTFGGTYSSAYLVNSNGQVVGTANTSGDAETHGFIYSRGSLTDIGTLGGIYSVPNAMNNQGQVVGESLTSNSVYHAFLWQNGQLVDLNCLLPAKSGWELLDAVFINDAGRVVGMGSYAGVSQWFILDLPSSNAPPVAVAGPDQTVDCQTPVTLDGSASHDPDNDPLSFSWSCAGTLLGTSAGLTVSLPLGTNVVTLQVTDACGVSAQTNVTVIVADTTPPSGSCPASASASADANGQAAVPDFASQVVATDNCTPAQALVITQNPVAGALVGWGPHPVAITVTDASGNSSTCTVVFTVVDTSPPVIQSLTVNPGFLCPPDHQLVPVTVSATVVDNCDLAPVTKIVSITCNGPASADEIQITGNLTAKLAASKGPSGTLRVYTINVQSTDASGNSSTGTVTVTVSRTGSGNSGARIVGPGASQDDASEDQDQDSDNGHKSRH